MRPETSSAGEAFTQLVREHKRVIFAIAYGRLGSSHDAEDVVQEVFIEAYRNFHKLLGHRKVSAWLYKAPVYRCKDHMRSKSRRQRRELEFATPANPSTGRRVDDNRAETVIEAIGRLPEKYRVVVMLKHFAMLSYAEISKMTGLSKTTIDGRLRSAKRTLKKTLTEMDMGVN